MLSKGRTRKLKKFIKVFVDGDVLVYRCGFAAEKNTYRHTDKDGVVTVCENHKALRALTEERGEGVVEKEKHVEPVEFALANVKNQVQQIQSDVADGFDVDVRRIHTIVMLSGPTNFRDDVATLRPYKGGRDPTHKPVHGPAILDYIDRKYDTLYSENEEADDMMGYMQVTALSKGEQSCIATIDKDLDMIPGPHFNFNKNSFYYVEPDEGDRFFYGQLITGDSTDNIGGLPGKGPKFAEKMKQDWREVGASVRSMYANVLELYRTEYGQFAEEALLENARLLWIRREPDQMWTPPEDNQQ
jgi:5'-3' exonuclease